MNQNLIQDDVPLGVPTFLRTLAGRIRFGIFVWFVLALMMIALGTRDRVLESTRPATQFGVSVILIWLVLDSGLRWLRTPARGIRESDSRPAHHVTSNPELARRANSITRWYQGAPSNESMLVWVASVVPVLPWIAQTPGVTTSLRFLSCLVFALTFASLARWIWVSRRPAFLTPTSVEEISILEMPAEWMFFAAPVSIALLAITVFFSALPATESLPIVGDANLSLSLHDHLRSLGAVFFAALLLGSCLFAIRGRSSEANGIEVRNGAIPSEFDRRLHHLQTSVRIVSRFLQETIGSPIRTAPDKSLAPREASIAPSQVGRLGLSLALARDDLARLQTTQGELSVLITELGVAAKQARTIKSDTRSDTALCNSKLVDSSKALQEAASQLESTGVEIRSQLRVLGELSKALEVLSQNLSSIEEQAIRIEKVRTSLVELTKQSNMLSLNTALIASRTDQKGRGLNIVANEMAGIANKLELVTQNLADHGDKIGQSSELALRLSYESFQKLEAERRSSVSMEREVASTLLSLNEQASKLESVGKMLQAGLRSTRTEESAAQQIELGLQRCQEHSLDQDAEMGVLLSRAHEQRDWLAKVENSVAHLTNALSLQAGVFMERSTRVQMVLSELRSATRLSEQKLSRSETS